MSILKIIQGYKLKSHIKICGIKNLDEAKNVLELDIDFIGVIFAKSPRRVDIKTARDIANLAHKFNKKCVGVFGGQSDCEIVEICRFASLDAAQIHGDINENLYANLKDLKLDVWKVLSVKDELIKTNEPHDLILYDCKGENLGGNGISFDWRILKDLEPFSFALAGGISAKNISQAIDFKPLVIDINSKVEDRNMIKNPDKVREILKIIGEKEIS